MLKKTSHNEYLGTLTGQGQSKVWQVTHDLPHFDGDFYWKIWGDKDGLTPAQT